jgi:class 3 adenylate cyclase/tetratricopeptide (TPR) repeat protein
MQSFIGRARLENARERRILVHMQTCPSCGRANPRDARFCAGCGRPLEAAAPTREERKVVTVLFCDLVGSTAHAERSDPEDVRALLSAYHERVRSELERFGGTVEKFIGDAVMALFGAPTAHEDDPERAVRAALAIRARAQEEGELQVRIGITTGEALVTLTAQPETGMASGAVVNTAARLQTAAPVDGILVDETTHRATERPIVYAEREAVRVKGKERPIAVWEAVEARLRFGVDVRQIGRTPLVNRVDELEALAAAFNRARREREPQLVTLVGVPGIGKSRLVWELFQKLDAEPDLTTWLQGRSLPYGEGVSFWALGEMIKAQANVLETDGPEQAERKLADAVAAVVSDRAAVQRLERHLRPLVGLEGGGEISGDRRDEAFAAWRRFFEALAEQPLVLVFEDLHFADDGLLDFVDYLADWARGVPILVIGTARPELLGRRSGWGGGKPHALTLSLSPLADEETAQLVHSLLDRPVLPADLQETLLERAGGNPLYAEEFARLLDEHEAGEELRIPETVQGLIAARVDGLSADEKALLQDAAVLGKVFSLSAAATLVGLEPWAAEELLHALERKEFVRRERGASVAGEVEFAFRHLLVRDVAYGQIPRSDRARKHRLAAEWIAALGRPEDNAETLAHHYVAALELASAAGAASTELEGPARLSLKEAGDRAFVLNAAPTAANFYGRALELWPEDDPARAELLFRFASALYRAGDERSESTLEDARAALLAAGLHERAAETDALLAELWWFRGQSDRAMEHLERARQSVENLPPLPGKSRVLSQVARHRVLAGDSEEAVRIGQAALVMAEQLGLEELQAHALNSIGIAKYQLGDRGSIPDLERSIEIALAANSPEAARGYHNLSSVLWLLGETERGSALIDEAIRVAEELGNASMGRYSRAVQVQWFFQLGRWEEAFSRADEFIAACEAGEAHYMESAIRLDRAKARLARGDLDGALDDVRKAEDVARAAKDPQVLLPALARSARLYAYTGYVDEARLFADEVIAEGKSARDWKLADLAWVAGTIGRERELTQLIERFRSPTLLPDVMQALLDRDFQHAAELFRKAGQVDEEAEARLRAAETLVSGGRHAEADVQLQQALAFYRSVGATRYIVEAETLLAASA